MSQFTRIMTSSVGRKLVMSFTGLFLCSFLVVHLSGNFLLFKPDQGKAFNDYSHFMASNGLIRFLEIGLVLGFLLHIIQGIMLTMINKAARPIGYKNYPGNETSNFSSRFMIYSGILVFVFLVIHIKSFFVPHRVFTSDISMYDSVKIAFENPVYAGFYIFSMILLYLHLNHGFQSAFQTLGLQGKSYASFFKKFGAIFSALVCLGFTSMPVYFQLSKMMGGN